MVGEALMAGLRALQSRCALIGDVRGMGLFVGVDLVSDRETRAPATAAASYVVNRMRERRILIGTEGPADNVLEGITAKSVMQMAADDLGIPIVQREIDRTELYIADEVFMTGTAAHLTPIVEIDRRKVGEGRPGPITSQLSELFYDAIRGRSEKYRAWCTPARARIAR